MVKFENANFLFDKAPIPFNNKGIGVSHLLREHKQTAVVVKK